MKTWDHAPAMATGCFISGTISEGSAPQKHGQDDGGLQQGKLVPYAFARATAKRDEGKVGGDFIRVQGRALGLRSVACPSAPKCRVGVGLREALWPELIWVAP